jgi:hypothetical protein
VHQIPNARPLPIAQAPPARHPRPAPEFLREHLPGNAAAKDEDDARQARAIRNAWSATLWPSWKNRQEGFDKIPQPIWKQRRGHTPFRLLRRRGQGSGGFVTRSKAVGRATRSGESTGATGSCVTAGLLIYEAGRGTLREVPSLLHHKGNDWIESVGMLSTASGGPNLPAS